MPSFRQLPNSDRQAIVQFLLNNRNMRPRPVDDHGRLTDTGNKKSDFPYVPAYVAKEWRRFKDQDGYNAIKPPWGTLNALDLKTGEWLWKIPLGEFPELTKKGVPVTGTENYGGPVVTAGGVIFIAGTKDERIRALDKKTGRELWRYQLPAGGFATPATYEVDGKQYVVIAAGGARGQKAGGYYVAFAL
jgi:quinoprotein glucose dehydrogenase